MNTPLLQRPNSAYSHRKITRFSVEGFYGRKQEELRLALRNRVSTTEKSVSVLVDVAT